jgi:hypothetical protein
MVMELIKCAYSERLFNAGGNDNVEIECLAQESRHYHEHGLAILHKQHLESTARLRLSNYRDRLVVLARAGRGRPKGKESFGE